MADNLQSLNDNLKLQADVYSALYKFAERKQQALINNNLVELEKITLAEEQLLFEASRLEKERLLWAEQIGQELNKPPEELTLSELAEHFPQFREVQIELENVVKQLIEVHELNTQLLEQALKIVNLTSALITQKEETTYANPQNKKSASRSSLHLLDRSV
jgi:hypothetical protein